MVERFLLPNRVARTKPLVDSSGRKGFHSPKDLVERINSPTFHVCQWREYQVNVVGHHHCDIEVVPFSMTVRATVEHDRSCPVGQRAALLSNKRDEMRDVIF